MRNQMARAFAKQNAGIARLWWKTHAPESSRLQVSVSKCGSKLQLWGILECPSATAADMRIIPSAAHPDEINEVLATILASILVTATMAIEPNQN